MSSPRTQSAESRFCFSVTFSPGCLMDRKPVSFRNWLFEILYIWFPFHIFYMFSTFPQDSLIFPPRRYPSFTTSSPFHTFQPDFSPKLFLVAEKFRFFVFRNGLISHLSWFLQFRGAGMLFLSLFEFGRNNYYWIYLINWSK